MDHQNVGHHQRPAVDQNLRPIVEPYLPQNQAVAQNLRPTAQPYFQLVGPSHTHYPRPMPYQPDYVALAADAQNLRPTAEPYIPQVGPSHTQNQRQIPYQPAESNNLNPMAQPYFPKAGSENIRPMTQSYIPQAGPAHGQTEAGPSHAQTEAGPSQPQNEKPRGLPYIPIKAEGRDYTIKPGHMFSKCYEDMSPGQFAKCANCRPNSNHFSFRANLVKAEDLCVRCLVAIAHWSTDLYAEYLDLKKENSAFSAHSKITYKTKLCDFFPNCDQGVDCVYAHGETELRVNQPELNPHVLAAVVNVVEEDNNE